MTISALLLAAMGCTSVPRERGLVDAGAWTADAATGADGAVDDPTGDAGPVDGAPPDAAPPDTGTAVTGPGRGEACPDGACAADLECVTDGSISMCVGTCDADDYSGCLRTESCNIPLDATQSACSPSCDLLTSDGCPTGGNCGVFADASGAVYKGCDMAGTRTQGEDCDSSDKCAPGHVCAYWSRPPYISGWECLQFCDLAGVDGPGCPEGTTCGSPPNEADPFAQIDGLGVCR